MVVQVVVIAAVCCFHNQNFINQPTEAVIESKTTKPLGLFRFGLTEQ